MLVWMGELLDFERAGRYSARVRAMSALPSIAARRRATRAHYDRYPFGFDQPEILAEKLEKRIMGEAIRGLAGPERRVVDVGCGACRVARLVKLTSGARMVNVDLSLESLRDARRSDPGPLVNGDNLQLPLPSHCADLVISNGVIHHTPDARAAFHELARIAKPGGTLVISAYDRRGWYYFVYHTLGSLIRGLRSRIGDLGLRYTVFPFFHVATVLLLSAATRRWFRLPLASSWTLFHDQFTTPQCTFHTFEELEGWAREAGLVCEERRVEAARQLATVRLRRPESR
jgi:ubiquinone/menaquinone biosynthesis C-methylase UbiE